MKKYLLLAAIVATTITAQANWFTELFESAEAQAIREHRSKYAICPDPYPCAYHQKLEAGWNAAILEHNISRDRIIRLIINND